MLRKVAANNTQKTENTTTTKTMLKTVMPCQPKQYAQVCTGTLTHTQTYTNTEQKLSTCLYIYVIPKR